MEKLPAGENEARADKACMFGMQGPDPDEKGTGMDPTWTQKCGADGHLIEIIMLNGE